VLTDMDAIQLYDIAFEKILPQSQECWASVIGELRWRCVKSDPRNEDSGTECFKTCLLNGDLDHAVKVGVVTLFLRSL
jgi:N-terminal acetyltransferase B complex non-catalytic subunit